MIDGCVHFLYRSGGTNRSFDIEVNTRGDTVYTFSSIEKDEYGRLYEFLKSKKISVKSVGKMDASKLDLSKDDVDHHAELVKADAESSSNSSMSSDDEDFNPDKLEAKDAKEEYDSDPSDTGSDSGPGEEEGSGSEAEEKKRVKAEKREQKAARKKTSAPRKERGEGKAKKKTKLPGQPKRQILKRIIALCSLHLLCLYLSYSIIQLLSQANVCLLPLAQLRRQR